jgi:hypothetical protein
MSRAASSNDVWLKGTVAFIQSGVPETITVRVVMLDANHVRVLSDRCVPAEVRVSISVEGMDPTSFDLPVSSKDGKRARVRVKAQAEVVLTQPSADTEGEFLHEMRLVGGIRIVE